MNPKILLTLILLAGSKYSFSQDTTGGTRPQVIIPLHRAKPKPKDVQTFSPETPVINTTTVPVKKSKHKRKPAAPLTPARID